MTCNLPSDWMGQWVDRGNDQGLKNRTEEGKKNLVGQEHKEGDLRRVIMNSTTLSISDADGKPSAEYHCVQWGHDRDGIARDASRDGLRTAPRSRVSLRNQEIKDVSRNSRATDERGANAGVSVDAGDGHGAAAVGEERMLVRTFAHGCRPRFTCVRAVRQMHALLLLQLSLPRSSPSLAQDSKVVDCTDFRLAV